VGWEWDPFRVLWLDHVAGLGDREVRRAFRARIRRVGWNGDREEAARVVAAFAALRTVGHQVDVLEDLGLNPDRWLMLPQLAALGRAKLPQVPADCTFDELQWVWCARWLAREAAGVRLERAAAGESAWPRSWVGRGWLRLRYGYPGRLAVRLLLAAAVPLGIYVVARGSAAVPALMAGALTWLTYTVRWDLAPRWRR
jgi:hypothetical protein